MVDDRHRCGISAGGSGVLHCGMGVVSGGSAVYHSLDMASGAFSAALYAVCRMVSGYTAWQNSGRVCGGSAIYEAVLYDAVRWNRTHYFDGTPFPTEAQRLRIYFFPYNCYTYEDRWELKH